MKSNQYLSPLQSLCTFFLAKPYSVPEKWADEIGLKYKYTDTRTRVRICLTFTIPAATAIILLNLIMPLKEAAARFWRHLFPHQNTFVCIPTGCHFLTKLNIRVWNKASEFHIFYLETFIVILFILLSLQVSVMVVAAGLSCVATVFISGYSCLTLTYGEEDTEVFHHHNNPRVVTSHTHAYLKGMVPNSLRESIIRGCQPLRINERSQQVI